MNLRRQSFLSSAFLPLNTLVLGLVLISSVHAASGVWTNTTTGGLWDTPGNWAGNTIADGAGNSADFNTLDITADNTVHLDSPHTIGSLIFGDADTSTAAGWTLDNNGSGANVLTLDGGTPTITVNALGTGKSATISATISGSLGLTKNGAGTLVLTGANNYTGGTTVAAGTLEIGDGTVNGTIGGGAYSIAGSGALRLNYATASAPTWANISGAGTLALNSAQPVDGSAAWGTSSLPASFTGTLALEKGRVDVATSTSLGNAALVDVRSGGQILFHNGTTNTYNYSQNFLIAGTGWGEGGHPGDCRAAVQTAVLNGTVTMTGDSTIYTQDSNGKLTFNGVIAGAHNLSVQRTGGAITFAAANTYSGTTTVTAGTLTLAHSLALQNSTLTTGGITFDSSVGSNAFTFGGLSGNGAITLQNNAGSPAAVALSIGNNNASTNFSGTLTGSGSVTKIGSGNLTFSGPGVTYTGATNINAGTLAITNNSVFNSPITVGASGALTLDIGGDVKLLQGVSGAGPINVTGTNSTARLAGDDSGYTGTFTLPNTARGMMWSGGNAGSAAAAWVLSGQFAAIETGAGPSTIHLGSLSGTNAGTELAAFGGSGLKTLEVGALGTTTTFAGQIKDIASIGGGGSGTVALTKIGGGTLTLSGNATSYTGPTNLNAGGLTITNNSAFNSPITIDASATLTLDIASDVKLNQSVSGSGPINVTGANSTARLAGDDSGYAGTFTLPNTARGMMWSNGNAGSAAAAWVLSGQFAAIETGAGPSTIQLGSLAGTNANTEIAPFTGSGLKTLEVGALNTNTSYAGQLEDTASIGGGGSGTLALSKIGTGTLTLTGANSYSGGTNITGGTLQLGNGTVNGTFAPSTYSIASGTTLQLNYATAAAPAWANVTGSGTFALNSAQPINASADWGQANLPAGFTGKLVLEKGRFHGNPTNFGGTSSIEIKSGAQILLFPTSNVTYTQPIAIAGTGWGEGGQPGALRFGPIADVTWAGSVTLAADSEIYTQGGGGNGTVTGSIGGNFNLILAAASGGNLTLAPAAAVQNSYASTTVGDPSANGGSIIAGNQFAFSTGPLLMNGGTLQLNNHSFSFANLSGTSGTIGNFGTSAASTISVNSDNSSTTYGGTLTNGAAGTLGLTKQGSGTLTLTGTNNWTGTATITGGTLRLDYATAVTPTWATVIGGGTLVFNSAQAVNGSANWGALNFGSGFTGTFILEKGRVNTNAAGLGNAATVDVRSGAQVLFHDGTANTYNYAQNFLIAGNGWGEAGHPGALRAATQTAVLNGTVTMTADSTVYTQDASAQLRFNGVISGAHNLTVQQSGGPITFAAANTYSGTTTVTAGTLTLAHSQALQNSTLTTGGIAFDSSVGSNAFTFGGLSGSGNITLQNSAAAAVALSIGNNNASTIHSGALGGSGSLTKIGTGTLTLAGSNSYAGTTTVNNGTLLVNGIHTGGGTYSVAAGAILGGTGSTASAATINGTLAPGASPGTLDFGGPLTFANDSTFAVELGGATPGDGNTFYDQVNMTSAGGSISLGTNVDLNAALFGGFTPSVGNVFYILTRADGGTFGASSFDGLPEGAILSLGLQQAKITYQANWTGTQAGSSLTGGNDVALSIVPEPTGLSMMLLGFLGLGLAGRKRAK